MRKGKEIKGIKGAECEKGVARSPRTRCSVQIVRLRVDTYHFLPSFSGITSDPKHSAKLEHTLRACLVRLRGLSPF